MTEQQLPWPPMPPQPASSTNYPPVALAAPELAAVAPPVAQPGYSPYGLAPAANQNPAQPSYPAPGPYFANQPGYEPANPYGAPQPYANGYPPQGVMPFGVVARPSNGLGTAGFVLGLVGLLFSITVILFFIGMPLGFIGLILGGVGTYQAVKGRATNRGLAIAGVVLSFLACFGPLVLLGLGIAGSQSY